jgi:hypothetical protein
MFPLMQDPGVASRLAHQHMDDRARAATRYRLAASLRTRPEKPSPKPTAARRPRARALRTLRFSLH